MRHEGLEGQLFSHTGAARVEETNEMSELQPSRLHVGISPQFLRLYPPTPEGNHTVFLLETIAEAWAKSFRVSRSQLFHVGQTSKYDPVPYGVTRVNEDRLRRTLAIDHFIKED